MASYVKRSPGNRCRVCNCDISDRAVGTDICLSCKKDEDKQRSKLHRDYVKKLEERDRLVNPIKEKRKSSLDTSKEYTYLICPSCNGVLNNSDCFCRFCGQRVRADRW